MRPLISKHMYDVPRPCRHLRWERVGGQPAPPHDVLEEGALQGQQAVAENCEKAYTQGT